MRTMISAILALILSSSAAFAAGFDLDSDIAAFQTTRASQHGASCLRMQQQVLDMPSEIPGMPRFRIEPMAEVFLKNAHRCVREVRDETSNSKAADYPLLLLVDACVFEQQTYPSRYKALEAYCH